MSVCVFSEVTFSQDGITYTLDETTSSATITSSSGLSAANVVIPSTVVYQGTSYAVTAIANEAFLYKTILVSVTMPISLKTIGNYAFKNCSNLETIEFPNELQSIGNYAFQNCSSLQTVTIPASVSSIGTAAFHLTDMKDVYMLATTPPVCDGSSTFTDASQNGATIHLPNESFYDYYCADGWMYLRNHFTVEGGVFSVRFYDKTPGMEGDGNLLLVKIPNYSDNYTEQPVPYGQAPLVIPSPTYPTYSAQYPFGSYHYGYTWVGWDVDYSSVTSDLIIHTRYAANPYTITFKNDNDTILEEALFEFNEVPFYSKGTPYKAADAEYSYEFLGWKSKSTGQTIQTLPAVVQDETYTAVYTAVDRRYVITFEDGNGNILQRTEYSKNALPAYSGPEPAKAGLTFAGWTPEITAATADATYRPVFKARVIFNDEWGQEWQNSLWEVGATPTYSGETPTHEQDAQYTYAFKEWPAISAATQNATYTAVFDKTLRKYRVAFFKDEQILQDEQLEYGTMPEYKGADLTYTSEGVKYNHVGWTPEIHAVNEEQFYYARFSEVPRYFVVFYDCDGSTELKKGYVEEGQDAVAPTESQEDGHLITGWDKDFTNVQSDLNVYAECELEKYTITLTAEHGTINVTDNMSNPVDVSVPVEYGTQLTFIAVPDEGYRFVKWGDELTENTRQITVVEPIELTALFELQDGTALVNTSADNQTGRKFLRNGQLFIELNGKTYNARGAEVK